MKKVIEKEKEVTESSATSFLMSGLLDSNQRPRAPQTCALPTALNPEHFFAWHRPLFVECGCKGTYFFRIIQIFEQLFNLFPKFNPHKAPDIK